MSITTKAGAAVLAATLALGAPAVADAHRGGPDGPRGADRDVPTRVAQKLRAADRALDRAQERADDGETAGAVTSLASVRKHLASALTAATRRITADGGRRGVASARAVSRADHAVVSGAVALLDGADASLTAAASETLSAALTNRDGIVTAIAALDADAKERYARVLGRIVADVDDETEAIQEALSDDTLTDDGRAALQAALTQLAATKSAAQAQVAAGDDEDGTGYETTAAGPGSRPGGREDCPPRRGSGAGTGYEDQDQTGDYGQA